MISEDFTFYICPFELDRFNHTMHFDCMEKSSMNFLPTVFFCVEKANNTRWECYGGK